MSTRAVPRKIESTYLKRLVRYNFLSTFFTLILITGSFFWMYEHIGGKQLTQNFSNASYALCSLIGGLWALQTAYRGRYGPLQLTKQFQLAWLCICAGLFSKSIGGFYYWYLQHTGKIAFPSYADIFFLLSYPLIFIGFLFIPAQRPFRIRMFIDAIITTCSLLGICWYFILGSQYIKMASQIMSMAGMNDMTANLFYPPLDLLSLLALFLLIQRRIEKNFRIPFLLLLSAQLSSMWANSACAYLMVSNSYQTGDPRIDPFWCIAPLLYGLAGLYHSTTLMHEAYKRKNEAYIRMRTEIVFGEKTGSSGGISSLYVYIPFVTLLVLCTYAEIFQDSPVSSGLVIISMLVSILVAARYLLATRENELLLQERDQQRKDSENLRLLVTRLNSILDRDKLLERTVSLAIEELGFTTVILLLSSQNDPEQIQVYVSSHQGPTMSWYFRENRFLQETAQLGKEQELSWSHHLNETPAELQRWLQNQHIASCYFLPLFYQDVLLGCLGIVCERTQVINQQCLILARAYCEQITTIIEHARLYQEAREHETFANAMTAIAVRLNSAVVEAAEIGHLICQEGTKALRADYAIIYLINEQKVLEPYAIAISNGPKSQELKDWPNIHEYEYWAQALYTSEPVLYQIPLERSTAIGLLTSEATEPRMRTLTARGRETRVLHQPTLHERFQELRIQTTLLAPLIIQEKAVGLLIFARAEQEGIGELPPFISSDLPNAQNFVEQARVAFSNARLYQRLRTAHQKLKELDLLKDQFMITASHELRTPLTAVQGYVELLSIFGDEITAEQKQEFLQKTRVGCEELVVMLSNIMDVSRLEIEAGLRPLYVSPVSIREIIEGTLIIIEPQLTLEQREVHMHLPGNLAVMADAMRLRQVLMNISSNALKYSAPSTPLGFFARVNSEKGLAVISIADKGKGILPEEQERVFQRFYRLETDINSPVRGSGLGLYISQSLIEAMGGKIWIESRGIEGEGSTFHIQLPIA